MEAAHAQMSSGAFGRIATVAKAEAGLLLPEVKLEMVQSRLARRLRALRLPSFEAYCDLVEADAGRDERRELINALTTNVTRFMREPHHFEEFAAQIAPQLADDARRGRRVRVWSAGCSSGEEPYSIAITALLASEDTISGDFKILATDIDDRVLAAARAGTYPLDAVTAAFGANTQKYFDQSVNDAVVRPDIRKMIAFKHLNLMSKWPMSGPFQAIFCRNTLIYFDGPTQNRMIEGFSKLLQAGGALFLGHSERVDADLETKFERSGLTSYRRK
ncbi:MAG: protein-glutamate O-methyltransferase [Pseudomonadota bacterium]